MKLKLAFATATALGLSIGFAWADGSNKVYTDQQGDNNQGTIWQNQATGSQIGTASNPILQDGSNNRLVIDQDGNNQQVGAAGGDFEQNGVYNNASILQQGSDNVLQTVYQTSNEAEATPSWRNELYVNQLGAGGQIGNVGQVNASGAAYVGKNVASITQEASTTSNIVEDVFQRGRNNSLVITERNGYRNVVGNAYQGQPAGNMYGAERASINLTLDGNYNGDVNTTGGMYIDGWSNGAGNGNDISQVGGNNDGGHTISASFTGNANLFGFVQYGRASTISAHTIGNWNQVGITQVDASSTSLVNITGDFNDVGITQRGNNTDTGNLATVNVGSSNNAAVVNQNGGNNSMAINQ